MAHLNRMKSNPAVVAALLSLGLACTALAAWNGAGAPGGTGTDINAASNWTGGAVSGDFSTIVSNANLVLTSDYTATNGMNFAEPYNPLVRHVSVSGTNALTLQGTVAGFSPLGSRNLFIPTNSSSVVTLHKGLTLKLTSARTISGNGTVFIDALVSGTGGLSPNYNTPYAYQPVIVLRNDANTFGGDIGGDCGRLHFTSIANVGVPSALGTGANISPNNYNLFYIGSRSRGSNRAFGFMHFGVGMHNNSGCGGLSLTGTVSISSGAHTCLTLGGLSAGESLMSGSLKDAAPMYTRLAKVHSGIWRLTGTNTFTGWTNNAYHVSVAGGSLIADYANMAAGANSNRLFIAGRTVDYNDGRLVVRGKAGAGNTTWQEFGTNTIQNNSLNVLAAEGNGGDGTTVTLNDVYIPNEYSFFRVERIGNATVRMTNAIPAGAGTVRNINGVLMGNSGARANLLVKDTEGLVGFATQNAALELVRYTNTLALAADNSSAPDHFALASSLTRTASLSFSTLSVDASASAVTLDMGGLSFQTNNTTTAVGRGFLVNGSNPVTVRNGAHGAQSSTFIYNHGAGKLSWELTNGTCIYVSAGPGLTEFTQPLANSLFVTEGTTRLTAAKNYTEGVIYVLGNGVLEIGADLNGGTAGDFSRAQGSGASQVYFVNGGGFSAYGADRTVNIGGGGGTVNWTAGQFVPEGKPFILSSTNANATLIFQNPLYIYNAAREIRVQNGSAAIDARLTGKISGYQVGSLVKSGAGTLELSGAQDYRGDVSVIGGGLRLGANDVFAGGTNALVLSAATLDAGTYRNTFNTLELLTNCVIEVGNGSAALAFADSSGRTWTGTLTVNGKLSPTTLRFGTDGKSLTQAQLASISNRGCSVYLDAQGYLRQIPEGTLIFLQ